MARIQAFEQVELTSRFEKSYAKLDGKRAAQVDDALLDLVSDPLSPGLRMKPIRPNNVYFEARVNSGDRLVIFPIGNTAYVMDVIKHDDIAKWGNQKRPNDV